MIQNEIWFSIIMYLVGGVVLLVVTFMWLTYRLKKKVRDDNARGLGVENNANVRVNNNDRDAPTTRQ